jgi:predicted branched-subunit amino acid permease
MMPWLAGVVPFGLVIGVSAAQADVPTLARWLTGPLIYAGSAQLAAIGMLNAGAAPLVVVAAALVINVRLIFYSATMARHWRGTPRWWQFLAAYLLIDPSFAVGLTDTSGSAGAAGTLTTSAGRFCSGCPGSLPSAPAQRSAQACRRGFTSSS